MSKPRVQAREAKCPSHLTLTGLWACRKGGGVLQRKCRCHCPPKASVFQAARNPLPPPPGHQELALVERLGSGQQGAYGRMGV